MNRIFTIKGPLNVPDGTIVYPFLNPKDVTSGLPWDLVEGFSIAAGDIAPHSASKIQIMPLVAQVTFVLRGSLELCVKDRQSAAPYTLQLAAEQAAIARPGTFLQLANKTDILCRVLYIVSPPYIFDFEDGRVLYDDAIVFDEDWAVLAKLNWRPAALVSDQVTPEGREAALARLANLAKRS